MNFLARFKPGQVDESEFEGLPPRRRTFSAAQYREEELARAAEARTYQQVADEEAAAAAEEARDSRPTAVDADSVVDAEPAESAAEPMDWEEAVGWLSTRSPEARSLVAQNWNWEHDLRVLQFLVSQPDMDAGVAAGIFWLTGATDDFFPWGDEESPSEPQFQRAAEIVQTLGRRFAAEDFTSQRFGFDDSWDCTGLKEQLEALYLDSRIDWTPANLPTVSPGPIVTLGDVPEGERAEVAEFLSRHGV